MRKLNYNSFCLNLAARHRRAFTSRGIKKVGTGVSLTCSHFLVARVGHDPTTSGV